MKKVALVLLAGACLVLGLFHFLTPHPQAPALLDANSAASAAVSPPQKEPIASSTVRKYWTHAQARPNVNEGDASASLMPRHDVTHQAVDFSKGNLENVVVTDALQMGTNSGFVSRLEPFRYFGVYVSPAEFSGEAFDVLTPHCEATPAHENELSFEFRTRPAQGDWTVWEEVTEDRLHQPFHLETPAIAWQYRFTFYANDAASSPQVRRVQMQTCPARNLVAAENQNNLPVHTP